MPRSVHPGGTSPGYADARAESERSSTAPSTKLAFTLLIALLLGWHAWLLARFAIDWPLHDDFTQILAVPGYLAQLDWRGKLALLVSLTPEHRIATLRLAGWLGGALPGGLDFKSLILAGNAMLLAAGAGVAACYPAAFRVPAAVFAVLLLTSSTHYGAQYWATGALQHFGSAFYGIAALMLVARGRDAWAIPFVLAAAFTSANGLCAFPAVVLLLALQRRKRAALAWAVAGLVIVASYFVGYVAPPGRPGVLALLADPASLASFTVATIGGIGGTFGVSLAIGTATVGMWAWWLASGRWRTMPPVVIAGFAYFALSCAMIALGRANLGIEGVAISRYRVYSAFAVLFTLAALASTMPSRVARAAIATAIALAAGLYAWAWPTHARYLLELAMHQTVLRDYYAAEGHGDYDVYSREFGDFTLRRAGDLDVYRGSTKATSAAVPTRGIPPAPAGPAPGYLEVHRGERAVSVAGRVDGRHAPTDLWLIGDAGAYRCPLASTRLWIGPRDTISGFHGTVDLASLPGGRHRVAVGNASTLWWTDSVVDR